MSTITLRVAEVEERLQLLRRRLNASRAQHIAYLGGSGLALLAALLIVAGLRASPQAFRVILWLSVAIAIVCVAYALWTLAQRWIDVTHAARLADRHGGLADRLTTLISLRSRPQTSRLVPLLVTQTLDLGERWRPERILPRRVPRSIFALFASLFLLVLTAFMQQHGSDATAIDPEAEMPARLHHDAPPQLPQHRGQQARGDRSEETIEALGPQANVGGELPAGAVPEAGSHVGSTPLEGTQLNELPDRVQDAIRRAFNAEPLGAPRQLGSGAEEQGSRGGDGREGSRDGKEAGRGGVPSTGEREAHGEAAEQPALEPRAGRDDKGGAARAGQRRDDGPVHGDRSGSSPSAGAGPGSVPPIGTLADLGKGAAAATFKLNITSFLAAVESQGLSQRDAGAGALPMPGGAAGDRELSDRQLNDDVLRKSEIPPQYEDVVRRAYSAGK